MRTRIIPNGSYCDNRPDGAFAVLVWQQHVLTHLGQVEFLDSASQPLFLRINDSGPLEFAGQGWGNGKLLTWNSQWTVGPTVGGVSPVIYRKDGSLQTQPYVYPNGSVSSQGWRFHDDVRLWNGDETYGPSGAANLIFGWTQCGDLRIGQGAAGGVVVFDGTMHRRVFDGACLAVRARREGDLVSIAFYRGTEAVLIWATADELRALPVYELPPPPAPPPVETKPIGPESAPLQEGTLIDVAESFAYDPACWPRGDVSRGDTHGMDMQLVTHKGKECIWFAKFAAGGKGRLGELLQIDDHWIHLLADCSGEESIDIWSDTRWLPRQMRIGRQYGIVDNGSILRKYRRDGTLLSEQGWSEENWIINVWPKFYCGADLGTRSVLHYAYNNTGVRAGQTTTNRGLHVETYYMIGAKA